jgi:hypothetical protein
MAAVSMISEPSTPSKTARHSPSIFKQAYKSAPLASTAQALATINYIQLLNYYDKIMDFPALKKEKKKEILWTVGKARHVHKLDSHNRQVPFIGVGCFATTCFSPSFESLVENLVIYDLGFTL